MPAPGNQFAPRVVRGLVPLAVAAFALALSGCGGASDDGAARADAAKAKDAPRAAIRITRWPKRSGRDGTTDVTVQLSAAPPAGSPRPRLRPAVAGSWSTHGTTEVFRPATSLAPCTHYRLTVPAGTVGAGTAPLRHGRSANLQVACPSVRGAQVALARLHYLPYRFTAAATATSGESGRRAAAEVVFRPHGTLSRRWSAAPTIVRGTLDPVTKGAVMAFQHRRGLTVDGLLGPTTWRALLAAATHHQQADHVYTWVTVSKGDPESLSVHRGSKTVLTSSANTGAPGAETPTGTFPIFEHIPASDMRGTNPDGSTYDDKGVPWVSYFNGGDAVHGFERASYGSRQSNGCVELPIATAKQVYGYLAIGDPVIISS